MSDNNTKYSIDVDFEIPESFDIYALRDKGIAELGGQITTYTIQESPY